ncbi:hypothetical protein [Halorhabdus amylolytica]|uniref:hypothetical protein n=1 Tax=Halorhabdus amylolytica TaxID=2559573 RepID=UPI0010AA7F94|nr:hypothetical protein [Halorhabdus amylolytica]
MSSDRSTEFRRLDGSPVMGPGPVLIPTVSTNGLGYEFVRCRFDGRYDTIYIHQLCAIADGADPHDVFGDACHTYHRCPIPWLNTPENIGVVAHWRHQDKDHREELPVSGSGD